VWHDKTPTIIDSVERDFAIRQYVPYFPKIGNQVPVKEEYHKLLLN
jgi:hypothetical protein